MITSWQIDGKAMEAAKRLYFWEAPKSLQTVTAAMKFLKDACSLEVKLCWERLRTRGEGGDRMRWLVGIIFNGHEFEQAPGVGDGQGSLA